MPNKRIARIHRSRHVIRFYSQKAQCSILLESFSEYLFACELECNPLVENYTSQPESMTLEIDSKTRRYTPDFLILYTDGTSEYVEVHNATFVDDVYRCRIEQFNRYAQRATGIKVRLVVIDQLDEVQLTNLKLLSSYGCDANLHLLRQFKGPKYLTLSELIQRVGAFTSDPIRFSYQLIINQFYTFTPCELLKGSSPLYRREMP